MKKIVYIFELIFVSEVCFFLQCDSRISDLRLCADQACSVPISEAVTNVIYHTVDADILSFPRNKKVTVYSKEAGKASHLWGIEIDGKRGYAPKTFLRETRIYKKKDDLKFEISTEELLHDVKPEQIFETFENQPVSVTPFMLAGVAADLPGIQKDKIDPQKVNYEVIEGTTIYGVESGTVYPGDQADLPSDITIREKDKENHGKDDTEKSETNASESGEQSKDIQPSLIPDSEKKIVSETVGDKGSDINSDIQVITNKDDITTDVKLTDVNESNSTVKKQDTGSENETGTESEKDKTISEDTNNVLEEEDVNNLRQIETDVDKDKSIDTDEVNKQNSVEPESFTEMVVEHDIEETLNQNKVDKVQQISEDFSDQKSEKISELGADKENKKSLKKNKVKNKVNPEIKINSETVNSSSLLMNYYNKTEDTSSKAEDSLAQPEIKSEDSVTQLENKEVPEQPKDSESATAVEVLDDLVSQEMVEVLDDLVSQKKEKDIETDSVTKFNIIDGTKDTANLISENKSSNLVNVFDQIEDTFIHKRGKRDVSQGSDYQSSDNQPYYGEGNVNTQNDIHYNNYQDADDNQNRGFALGSSLSPQNLGETTEGYKESIRDFSGNSDDKHDYSTEKSQVDLEQTTNEPMYPAQTPVVSQSIQEETLPPIQVSSYVTNYDKNIGNDDVKSIGDNLNKEFVEIPSSDETAPASEGTSSSEMYTDSEKHELKTTIQAQLEDGSDLETPTPEVSSDIETQTPEYGSDLETPTPEDSSHEETQTPEQSSEVKQDSYDEPIFTYTTPEDAETTTETDWFNFDFITSLFSSDSDKAPEINMEISVPEEGKDTAFSFWPSVKDKLLPDNTCSAGVGDPTCEKPDHGVLTDENHSISGGYNHEDGDWFEGLKDSLQKVSVDAFLYLVVTAIAILLFSLGYYYIENHRHDGALIARINMLERDCLVVKKEAAILEEELKIAKDKSVSSEEDLSDYQSRIDLLTTECEELKGLKLELEEHILSLERELETVSESNMEMNQLLSESLSTEDGSQVLLSTVETMREKLEHQNTEMRELNRLLSEKSDELENIYKELKNNQEAKRSLQEKLTALKREKEEELLKLKETTRHLTTQLDDLMESKSLEELRLNNEISKLQMALSEAQTMLGDREGEIDALKEAVAKLHSPDKDDDLETLYNVAKVNGKLAQAEADRNNYKEKFQEEEGARKLLEGHVQVISQEVASLKENYEAAEKDKIEALTKLQVLSNYFKEKESQLQKELGSQESMWLQKQSDDHTIYEQMKSLREENEKYKLQIESLKKEIVESESDYKIQVANTEQKAHDNWLSARQFERRLKESQNEATQLRNRLTLVEKNATNHSSDDLKQNISMGESNGDPSSPPPSLPMFPPTTSPPFMMFPSAMVPPADFIPPPPLVYPEARPPTLGRISSPSLDHRFSPPPPPLPQYVYDHPPGPYPGHRHSPSPPPHRPLPKPHHHHHHHRDLGMEQKEPIPSGYSESRDRTSRRGKR